MKRGTVPLRRPPKRQEGDSVKDVLAQLQHMGCIYFIRSLSKIAIQINENKKSAILALPRQFVREHGDKIEEWVILRAHSSSERSTRPWPVRLSVSGRSPQSATVRICGGFNAFVYGNDLREGDTLIFVLNEDAQSEFVVHMFCGPRHFPEESDGASADEENCSNQFRFPGALHHQDMHKKACTRDIWKGNATAFAECFEHHRVRQKAFTYDIREGWVTPFQNADDLQNHRMVPCFCKRLTATNIGRSDRDARSNSGQFSFPKDFIRTHGKQIRTSVKLQGIHEDSPTHIMTCRPRPREQFRVDFRVTGWSRFVKENDLKKGHWLQFSLMADSYFLVRKF